MFSRCSRAAEFAWYDAEISERYSRSPAAVGRSGAQLCPRSWTAGGDSSMAPAVHQALAAGAAAPGELSALAHANPAWFGRRAFAAGVCRTSFGAAGPEIGTDAGGRSRIAIAPPLQRTPIVAHPRAPESAGALDETANRKFDLRPRAKQRRYKKAARSTALPQPEPMPVAEADSQDQHERARAAICAASCC